MLEEKTQRNPNSEENRSPNGLTGIPQRIHCAATNEGGEPDNELDRIASDNFLETFSQVALSIAAREAKVEEIEGN